MKTPAHFPALPAGGYTLIELLAVLAALGIALAIASPVLARTLDGLAVRAARDTIVAELARARLLARLHGGASVVLDTDAPSLWVESTARDTLSGPHDLGQFDARLDLGGEARATIVYDRLGIGRLANRTIRVTRGAARARITVSAYGRVRAW